MRLAAYLRVSSDSQLDGLGLDIQRAGIISWAAANGHEVASWYSDEGVSGSNGVDTRRGLFLALNALRDGEVSGLVVYRLDRLSRKLTVQESTLAMVWGLSGAFFSVDHGLIPADDPDDPMRTALRQMIGVFAELERGMIVARLRAGRAAKAAAGGYAGEGPPPFGYTASEGELVEVAAEQVIIARMLSLAEEGAALSAIAATLNSEGLPSKRGGLWHPEQVRRVLRRAAAS